MFEIAAIDHLVLRTAQVDEMVNFYCRVLGCTVERIVEERVEERAEERIVELVEADEDVVDDGKTIALTQLRAGNALIDLVNVSSSLGKSGGGAPVKTGRNLEHFCLQLKAISSGEIYDYLTGKGIKVGQFHTRYGAQGFGDSVYIEDPDGNTVELKSQQ
ncbi:VOC family protein [Thalassomonas viridans]|uniref:VOC family protein n=1 Tax=Thalassomonas viridans TaxID=137584 RepID=A0AAE9YZP2_9GAMM|nr:VOC family protein [Thalassomonas viridans]WDE03349.1 VOC family protein [Thalassomonas viridans]